MMLSILLFIALAGGCSASRILAVFPLHYKSHFMIASALVTELADRGHSVTMISRAYELKHPNVASVVLNNQPEVDMFSLADVFLIRNFFAIPNIVENAVKAALSHESVVPLLKEKFDAVIVEIFMTEALYGLGVHFDCPVIGLTTFGVSMWTNLITRTPYPPSYVPNLFTPYSDDMSFLERLHNTFVWSMEEILWHLYHYPKQVALYESFFPQEKPPLMDVIRNVSLILNNNYLSTTTVKPTVPSVIDIGGMHMKPAKPLPDDIQEFLDSAKDGAILFSMGSCLKGINWPEERRRTFVKIFGKLKQKVIWKYENDTLPDKPDNVMISKWLPQRDILAHPNVKLFITHGGLLGTTEAIHEGVAMLAIPIYGDQRMNAKVSIDKGIGLVLDFRSFSENDLEKALKQLLNEEKFSVKANEIALIHRDRIVSPRETACYWVEYVIRHKGAPHLRSAALKMSYFEFYNVDVYLFVTFTLSCIMYALKFMICKIFTHTRIKQKVQ